MLLASMYERIFPRWRPRAELRPRGGGEGAPLKLSWLGTAGYVIETPGACVLVDPFLTRGGLLATALKPIVPDEDAIRRHLPARVDAVLCGHSHYDHAADAPLAARLTGARLVGSASTCAWGRAAGLPESKLVQVPSRGAIVHVGDLEVRFVPSRHGRVKIGPIAVPQLPGEVSVTPRGPGRVMHYKMGGAFGILIKAPGVTLYHNGSADLVDAELEGERADVLVAGLAGRRGDRELRRAAPVGARSQGRRPDPPRRVLRPARARRAPPSRRRSRRLRFGGRRPRARSPRDHAGVHRVGRGG